MVVRRLEMLGLPRLDSNHPWAMNKCEVQAECMNSPRGVSAVSAIRLAVTILMVMVLAKPEGRLASLSHIRSH